MRLHPATLLAAWIAITCALPWLDVGALAGASGLALAGLINSSIRARAIGLLRRTRVLLMALLVIYGLATPGAPLFPEWPAFGPTAEGIVQGLLQAGRLGFLLLALAWLLASIGQSGLLVGVYTLSWPFGKVGLPVDRFAVRLSLTLNLAESGPRMRFSPLELASAMDSLPAEPPTAVAFDLPPASWRDALCLLGLALILGWLVS
jgi:energy-coupling factor transport system permease protein